MDLNTLHNMAPWEWPEDTDKMLLDILQHGSVDAPDRLLAVELAGDQTVISDAMAAALLDIVKNSREADEVRGMAAIAFGPALEHADMMGFKDEDDVVISEAVFHEIRQELQKLYAKTELPKKVHRRILEASVRAPQPWHREAVRVAYETDDEDWRLTAVFCMQFIAGFEAEILEALKSADELIHYHAVVGAGNWEIDEAWDHVAKLASSNDTDKDLRIVAIEAVVSIRTEDARAIVHPLLDSDDEDIADVAQESLIMAEGLLELGNGDFDDGEEDDDGKDFL